jgi:hypothetical protein
MTPSTRRLRSVLAALRANVRDLDAILGERRAIDQGILDELDGADLPTSALASRLRRRTGDVRVVTRLMEAQGQIKRAGRRWTLVR